MACFLYFMGRLKDSLSAYIRYRLSVQSKFSLHSPFIYAFWAGILKDNTRYPVLKLIEKTRTDQLNDNRVINRLDFGAGQNGKPAKRSDIRVGDLARRSLVSVTEGEFLFKLVKVNKPLTILEFGTSLGLSSLYLAAAAPEAKIISMEGCSETAGIAASVIEKAGMKNISIVKGRFEDSLPEVLEKMPLIDLVFFDGNHRRQPTLDYFNACLPHLHPQSVAVLDDIHWSNEMEAAWKEIIGRPEVKVSIDLFHLGVLFFREELSKEDFVLRF